MGTVFFKVTVSSHNPENEPVAAIHDAIRIARAVGQGVWLTWSDGRTSLIIDNEDPSIQVDRYWRERWSLKEKEK